MKAVALKSFISAGIIFALVFGLHFSASHAASPLAIKQKQIDYNNPDKYLKSGKQSTIENTFPAQIDGTLNIKEKTLNGIRRIFN